MIKFTGVMPALVTPLNGDESLNREGLKALMASLLREGADGFYVGGATGEGIALRKEVRMALCEEAVAGSGNKPCIVHIASTVFSDALELARHAEKCGASAISAIPPLFFGYNEDDVYAYYKRLAESVHIPLIMYYNPAAGFTVNASFAAKCFKVDNITGIKWTSSDYFGMIRLKDMTNGEMNIINGPDQMLLMGLCAGADGGIGTTYNVILPVIKRIYESYKCGNIAEAQKAQTEADRIIEIMNRYPLIPATKKLLQSRGFDVGEATFPLPRLTDEQQRGLFAALKALEK